jgi:hypothetical protein
MWLTDKEGLQTPTNKRRGRVVGKPASFSGGFDFEISSRRADIISGFYCLFLEAQGISQNSIT